MPTNMKLEQHESSILVEPLLVEPLYIVGRTRCYENILLRPKLPQLTLLQQSSLLLST